MKVHELKILPEYFVEVITGNKKFEVRKNDRDFNTGDCVKLNEYKDGEYTGNFVKCEVGYILDDPNYCADGMVVFSIDPRYWSLNDVNTRGGEDA